MGTGFFHLVGRYFWILALLASAYNHYSGMRALESMSTSDPRTSSTAISLRRWVAIAGLLPWVVMGWGIFVGGVPNVWYFFRPKDGDPYVLAWFATLFALTIGFAFWVFLLDGALKLVVLQPFQIKWQRFGFRGTTQGTIPMTVGRVKWIAALGPVWMLLWTLLVYAMDASVPK